MKILEEDSIIYKKLLDCENYLNDQGIRIVFTLNGLLFIDEESELEFSEIFEEDNRCVNRTFPRSFDCQFKQNDIYI